MCRRWRLLAIKSWHRLNHLDFRGAFTSFKGIGGISLNVHYLKHSHFCSCDLYWYIHISRELNMVDQYTMWEYENQLLHHMDLHNIVAKYLELFFCQYYRATHIFIRIWSITWLLCILNFWSNLFCIFNAVIFILLSEFGIVVNLLIRVLFGVYFRSNWRSPVVHSKAWMPESYISRFVSVASLLDRICRSLYWYGLCSILF